jgi:glycerol uptake facilitator-like aquaporin
MSYIQSISRNLVAEFIGTMGLIFAAIGSIILPQMWWGSANAYVFVFINAVSVGFVLFALIEALGPLSGAHFNPAVTLAMLVTKQISPKKAACYIVSQLAGAFVGVLLLNFMFYDPSLGMDKFLYISTNDSRQTVYVLVSELICAFMLVAIIFGCVRGGSNKTSLAVGLFVGGMIVCTSATMFANPAVDFARIFTNAACGIAPVNSILFMAMDVIGAILAALVFSWLYPAKLAVGEKCDPYDCSVKTSELSEEGTVAPRKLVKGERCDPYDCSVKEGDESQLKTNQPANNSKDHKS